MLIMLIILNPLRELNFVQLLWDFYLLGLVSPPPLGVGKGFNEVGHAESTGG